MSYLELDAMQTRPQSHLHLSSDGVDFFVRRQEDVGPLPGQAVQVTEKQLGGSQRSKDLFTDGVPVVRSVSSQGVSPTSIGW